MSQQRNLLHVNTASQRQEVLDRYPAGSTIPYTTDGRLGVVLDVDTEAKRLLIKRVDIRMGEWERIALPLAELESCSSSATSGSR